jgi:DNA helicase-2/ATP-dependent DNA helicase PcrA
MSKLILEGLNREQTEAILHDSGPLLLLAGAGSGKTRVITHRFSHLAGKHSPSSIFTATFTNKAADEMKKRISLKSKKPLRNSWIGTFHSLCTRILRKEIRAIGYRNDFTIFDDVDQCNLIRHILKEFKHYEALYKGIQTKISHLKSAGVTAEEFLSNGNGFGFEERLARVYVRYQDELKRCNSLDFDDLIMLTVRLFKENPEILETYQDKFSHVLVDEFQDTNSIQYELLKLLVSKNQNICVVGDDDQSIYGFRGASVRNILNFEKDFPKARTIRLEQNYRSTQIILDVSNGIIRETVSRKPKKLWSDRKDGDKVSHCWFANEKKEAKYIAKLLKEFYLKGLYDYSDFAVLYRTGMQSKPIEDALRRERVPYRVLRGISYYQRKEIKDITAYTRLALNRDDNVSLRRIINYPPRGIGASTLSKIEQLAKKKSTSLYSAIQNILSSGNLTSLSRGKLEGFIKIIEDISSDNYKDAADMLQNIYIKTGYSSVIEDSRVENITELVMSAKGKKIEEMLDMFSLASNNDENANDTAVSLLTLHSAKGLEFPVVFITGLEEGILPYFKAKEPKEIDEERRLLYVGMTRAKDILCLSGAERRSLYSKVQEQEPSRFLKCLPEHCCVIIDKVVEGIHSAPQKNKKLKTFKPNLSHSIGSRVRHPKWGIGVVRDCYGEDDDQKITVNFPNIGVKRLALKFANLEKIG